METTIFGIGPLLRQEVPALRGCIVIPFNAAEAVSQAADLSDDQVDEGVDQLIKDLQVLVLLEAAETLSDDTTEKKQEVLKKQSTWLQSFTLKSVRYCNYGATNEENNCDVICDILTGIKIQNQGGNKCAILKRTH